MAADPRLGSEILKEVVKKIPEWISDAIKAWFRFFWRLGPVGKIIVTVFEIIALVLVTSSLHLHSQTRHSIVQVGAIALMFLLIIGILVGKVGKSD